MNPDLFDVCCFAAVVSALWQLPETIKRALRLRAILKRLGD